VWATWVQFSPILLFVFKHLICNGIRGQNVYFLVLIFALSFFSFFIHSYSRTRIVQLVSQCERLKVHIYFTTVELYTLWEYCHIIFNEEVEDTDVFTVSAGSQLWVVSWKTIGRGLEVGW
jgi:hypothetical protein